LPNTSYVPAFFFLLSLSRCCCQLGKKRLFLHPNLCFLICLRHVLAAAQSANMVSADGSYSLNESARDDAANESRRLESSHEPCSNEAEGNQLESGALHKEEPAEVQVRQAPAEEVVERKHENFFIVYLRRLKGAGQAAPSFWAPSWDGIPAFLFTAICLEVLAVIEAFGLQPYDKGLLSYLPSFGASCCMVFCLLTSPGAQPRALILTHIFGAFFGVSWAHITNHLPKPLSQQIACAFAVGMMTALMMLFGALQPSASATTCLAAFHLYGQMRDQGFMFMVTPATLGPCVIVFLGILLNNLIPWRHCYPVWW
jgi:hypothetical protein